MKTFFLRFFLGDDGVSVDFLLCVIKEKNTNIHTHTQLYITCGRLTATNIIRKWEHNAEVLCYRAQLTQA